MRLLIFILCFISFFSSAGEIQPKPISTPIEEMSLDAHEVRGVDRGELSLSMDDQVRDESLLDAIDDGETHWKRRILQSTEDLTQW